MESVKSSTIHGPRGDVNVENLLQDLQDNVHKLKDRFKSGYAGNEEVTTVLRLGNAVQRYMSTQPPEPQAEPANGTGWRPV